MLTVTVWVLSGKSGFFVQSKDVHVTGYCKTGNENECQWDWLSFHMVLPQLHSWDGCQSTSHNSECRRSDARKWMDG